METKKDIYNLWIQYTTKNDELYFRQFVSGFVQIWRNQLNLDVSEVPLSINIKTDSGPHLSRLPDELLPAITKFIIIARDEIEKDQISSEKLEETSLLIECLIIISRNFENITTIVKHDFIGNLIALLVKLYSKILESKELTSIETEIFDNFCKFLEVIYDPYFTWRNFFNGNFLNSNSFSYTSNSIHVEVIPFMYDCFQYEEIFKFPSIGISLVHALGSIISGSQNNGLRAICPATVSIIINIISKWECTKELRQTTLKCFALMVIVLQRSSPEERQIELVTIIQLYSDAIFNLLKIEHFKNKKNQTTSHFEIIADETSEIPVDVTALQATIENVNLFLLNQSDPDYICSVIFETNLVDILISVPFKIEDWNINTEIILCNLIKILSSLTKSSNQIIKNINETKKIDKLFDGIQRLGKPTEKLLQLCFSLAFDNDVKSLVIPEVILKLIKWLTKMNENEQNYLSNLILKGCTHNYKCKLKSCEVLTIFAICDSITNFDLLSEACINNLLKLMEELAKLSIQPKEMKRIMWLLRRKSKFPYSKKLLQSLVTITLQSAISTNCRTQYLDIQNPEDGIIVQGIKNWTVSGSYGFIFHCLLRLDPIDLSISNKSVRRMIFRINTSSNIGYEIFMQNNGNLIVAALTRREYLTSSVTAKSLLDGRWHYITVAILPPKRPFSYSQINVYIDFLQKLSTTLKVQSISEPFSSCTIGSTFTAAQPDNLVETRYTRSASQDNTNIRGILPNFLERTLSSNVSNYFTLPLRSSTGFDPNVKNFPIGMENNVFGDPTCLRGQIDSIILADPATNIKTIFDIGDNFPSMFSQDAETLDIASRFVFCYSAASYYSNICPDLVPGGKFPGVFHGQHYRLLKIQNTIHSIGGIQCILPILDNLVRESENLIITSDNDVLDIDSYKPSKGDEFSDWDVISTTSYTEWKMLQNPIASFICFLRYLTQNNEKNQNDLLTSKSLEAISMLLMKCDSKIFDVHALMSIHLFIESIQNQQSLSNYELLNCMHSEIAFNFAIWSRMQFQITLGHIQYLGTMIKNDRKYFRKNFGVQFVLDTIRYFYSTPDNIPEDDAKTIRSTLLNIIRYYLQKDINIKEVGHIISFVASTKQEQILIELLEMLLFYLKGKSCKDQMVLLLYEPNTAVLFYNIFIDKLYSDEIHSATIRIIDCLLSTSRVQLKYKQFLRLQEISGAEPCSLYPGLFSFISPFRLNSTVLLTLIDHILLPDIDYCALIFLMHHMSLCDVSQKLEIVKKLFQNVFARHNALAKIAQQTGWQESIARLLIRKPISVEPENVKTKNLGLDFHDILLEDNNDFVQADLITFCENQIGDSNMDNRENNLILNEIQTSVTEAANVLENEIKEIAESVTGVVAENVSNVFSALKQRTSEFQESLESFGVAMGTSIDLETLSGISIRTRTSSNSSEDQSSSQSSVALSKKKSIENNGTIDSSPIPETDVEEELVYLITNALFTVLWRGVGNENIGCWKERGQVLACINLLGLNNELITSHLTIKLRILELGVQASLSDLTEQGHQTLYNQENAYQLLRMVYDLVVLGSNEDESKKCSIKLLDGVLSLIDSLMIFQQGVSEDWSDMIRLSLGLLLKCSVHPDTGIVAMATAKLLAILQNRALIESTEMAFLLFSVNVAIVNALEVDNKDLYSFLLPVIRILLNKCREIFALEVNIPDLPQTTSGPDFFKEFEVFVTTKRWKTFMDKKIKPLYDVYQKETEATLWEPINRFWAECYEACKAASKKRGNIQYESRKIFQHKIITPWKVKQIEELSRLNMVNVHIKTKNNLNKKRWKSTERFLYGLRGPWYCGTEPEEFWKLSNHENTSRMRLKLEPQLYPNQHEDAANLRDNASFLPEIKDIASDFDSTIKTAVVQDFLTDDENVLLEEELRSSVEAQPQDALLEKAIITQDCELITLMTKIKGRIEVNQDVFTFTDTSLVKEDKERNDFRFLISKIREVHLRKYNLRRSALEIFLVDQTSYFLNFTTKTRNKIFTKILSLQPPHILYGSGRSPPELLKSSGLTQKWVAREISNFEYLMYLNTIAGRSYNDLSQYPVFPWILSDYTSEILDLTDHTSFRDLSKPIGVVNPKNEAEVRAKYESFEDPSGAIPKFHYGTHYSNSAGVLHYLLRVEPFTSLHIELQSGRFDVADRQFHSIPQTWKLLMDNPNDVKELIPEFFYFPEFLKNMNKFDLGVLQITKEKVDDVILPRWASTPEEFIEIHRRALESEYVSQNLHHWIDLIFGYKQKGLRAVEALNVFYYCSYEGAVDLDKIKNPIEREAIEGMINNFGQIPSQLLREPHPRRLNQEETLNKLLKYELKKPDITQFLDRTFKFYCDISTPKDPIVYLSVPRSPPKSFLQVSPDILISISKSQVLGCNSWMSYDKEKGFLLEIDATTTNIKNRKKVFGPFHPSIKIDSQIFAVSLDGKHLYAGGIFDSSLRVFNLHKGKLISSVVGHLDTITCLALDNCGSYLVTGSKDCTCVIWSTFGNQFGSAQNNQNNNTSNNNPFTPVPLTTLYGHDDVISSVAIYTELDMVVSGSKDGSVNVYSIQDGQYIRTLRPQGCTEQFVEITFITISYQGHIAFSALDDTSHSVHVFNVNGYSLGSKYVSGRVTGLTTASDYLIVVDDAGDITISRLYGLKPVFEIPLHVPIQTVVVSQENTHILAPLRDGKIAVIGIFFPPQNRKQNILNV
ncbi:neurobeachin-like protein 1 isoform X2 [Condylostylus longicornis]|uniref:neurobeachin-like protein 1 isoform X2 n=1 Tax=Condylostylus longicornis TaxID=2530218 RepID=UPI00244E19E0|nr:neurobeachin-like protein 1 isoform X2 [Condylostylus longicornis]